MMRLKARNIVMLSGLVAILVVFSTASLEAVGIQRKPWQYRDKRIGTPTIIILADDGTYNSEPASFTATGHVNIDLKSEGVVIHAQKAEGTIRQEKDPKNPAKTRQVVDKLTLTGEVEFIQDKVTTDAKGNKTVAHSVTTATKMFYVIDSKDPEVAIITLEGGVKTIAKNTGGETTSDLIFTGRGGVIDVIREPAKGQEGIIRAVFNRDVAIDLARMPKAEADAKPKLQRFIATADKLVYAAVGPNPEKMPQIDLLGNLILKSLDGEDDGPQIDGADSALIVLNAKNEVDRFKLSNTTGSTITTRIKPKKKPGVAPRCRFLESTFRKVIADAKWFREFRLRSTPAKSWAS